jgi:hypothetical protein
LSTLQQSFDEMAPLGQTQSAHLVSVPVEFMANFAPKAYCVSLLPHKLLKQTTRIQAIIKWKASVFRILPPTYLQYSELKSQVASMVGLRTEDIGFRRFPSQQSTYSMRMVPRAWREMSESTESAYHSLCRQVLTWLPSDQALIDLLAKTPEYIQSLSGPLNLTTQMKDP